LPIALEVVETRCILRLEDDIDITCSGELKNMLIEALSSRKEVRVDLEGATDLDITIMQLLWAAALQARRSGASFAVLGVVPENIECAVRDAGFETFPVPMPVAVDPTNSPRAASLDGLDD
jgi:anti-anti-sigma regulatory factor